MKRDGTWEPFSRSGCHPAYHLGPVTKLPAQSSTGTLGEALLSLGSRTFPPADHPTLAQTVAATSAIPSSWSATEGPSLGGSPYPMTRHPPTYYINET